MTHHNALPDRSMPTIAFGSYSISRLIMGANPINGGSHLSRFVNQQMKRYFTPRRVLDMFRHAEDEGVNAWQSGPQNLDLYQQHRAEEGQMHYISLAREDPEDPTMISRIVDAGAIAIAHHGEVTDRMFKDGHIEQMRDFLAKVRDTGLMAGVSTHMPAVVDYVESRGWDIDFYMTCVYERHRTREELKALLGYVPLPVREVYLEEDPPRMFKAMRQTPKPCLAFKILAAGRLCDRQETVEQAFRQTFQQIKLNDAVIVGMYPQYEDQVRINAEYVREFGHVQAASAVEGRRERG